MASFSFQKLSGSTNGRNIKVVATASTGTTIHTAVSGTSSWDLVTLYACNTDTTDRKVTIELGGTTSPDDLMEITIPAESGYYKLVEDFPVQNSIVITAFAAAANVINIYGKVKRLA